MENIFHRRRAEEVLDSAFARIDLPSNRLEAFDYYTPRAPKKRSRGRKPPAPEPTNNQIKVLMAMQREGRTQVAIANALGVPRSRVRIWYQRRGLAPLTRLEGHMIGRADARARVHNFGKNRAHRNAERLTAQAHLELNKYHFV
jgi:hypothetical protein